MKKHNNYISIDHPIILTLYEYEHLITPDNFLFDKMSV